MRNIILLVFSLILSRIKADVIPKEACRFCCDEFVFSSSFQIGCRTVGCLIGLSGSCPGGNTPATSGCIAGQDFVSTGETNIDGQLYFCEYSETHGAGLFDTRVANTIDDCASCCSQLAGENDFEEHACWTGCSNHGCDKHQTDCLIGLDFMLTGSSEVFDKRARCLSGNLVLESIPTTSPTPLPTTAPSKNPTFNPTSFPTMFPTTSPTKLPTVAPTNYPTKKPSKSPSFYPTGPPSTAAPTMDTVEGSVFERVTRGYDSTTIVSLIAGLVVSALVCILFLTTSSSHKRYVIKTPLPERNLNGNTSHSQEGPLIFT